MSEFDPKYSTRAGEPILVSPGADADRLGRHYTALHEMQCSQAYKELGQKVETRYTLSVLVDGTIKLLVVEDHY